MKLRKKEEVSGERDEDGENWENLEWETLYLSNIKV